MGGRTAPRRARTVRGGPQKQAAAPEPQGPKPRSSAHLRPSQGPGPEARVRAGAARQAGAPQAAASPSSQAGGSSAASHSSRSTDGAVASRSRTAMLVGECSRE